VEKALLCVGNLHSGNHGTGMNDTIANVMPADWQKAKLYEDYGLIGHQAVNDSINAGFHLSNMLGHGSIWGIYYGGTRYYRQEDPLSQTNDSATAIIVTSNACQTGAVDLGNASTDFDSPAERMVNSNKQCAVASMMNTRFGWSAPIPEGCFWGTDEIILYFYRSIFDDYTYSLGDALAAAKDALPPPEGSDWCLYVFTLFGDPEMPVHPAAPVEVVVNHAPVVATGASEFEVTVTYDGWGVEDARVCCWIPNQDPEMYVVGYTVDPGVVVLNISPTTVGDTMYVTVTRPYCQPYRGTVVVNTGPYVTAGSLVISDTDANGQINPTETIDLGVWARNWGNHTANYVRGVLSTSDPYVTVTRNYSWYRRILPGDSALSARDFQFTVAPGCPDDHVVEFALKFTHWPGYYTWTSYFEVTVDAPVLTYQDADVVEDNGDGVLSPAETAGLVLTVKNEGGATVSSVKAALMTESPYVTVLKRASEFGEMLPDSSTTNTSPFVIVLDSQTPCGTQIDFSLITYGGDYKYIDTLDFTMTVYCPVLAYQSVIVVNDDNDNGFLEPGETADLVVTLGNDGEAMADDVVAQLNTTSPHITILDAEGSFHSIASGATGTNGDDVFTVTASLATPYFDEVDFSLDIQAGYYNTTADFSVTVYVPVVTVHDVIVVNDDNGNGALEPGETGDLVVTLENEGEVAAENLTAIISTNSSDITITDNAGSFGTIDAGSVGDNAADPYTVTASITAPYFSHADISLAIESGVYVDTHDFALLIGDFPPSDTGYYYAYYSGGPHIQSPVFDWIAIDSTQTQYPGTRLGFDWPTQTITITVDLPFTFRYYGIDYDKVSVCAYGYVTMGVKQGSDKTNSPIPHPDGPKKMIAVLWDYLWFIHGDPGAAYYYYDEPNHRFIIEYHSVSHLPYGWPGKNETFEVILHDPAYYPTPTGDGEITMQYLRVMRQGYYDYDNTIGIENLNENVGVQYYHDSCYYHDTLYDNSVGHHPRAGLITDSFAIKYTTDPQGVYPKYPYDAEPSAIANIQSRDGPTTTVPVHTLMSRPHPNPFTNHMKIAYQIGQATNVDLKVYDAAGRLVRSLVRGMCNPGYHSEIWDGCDDTGRKVSAGIYFVRFETDDYTKVNKTILLR
jgi:hypothetical protein